MSGADLSDVNFDQSKLERAKLVKANMARVSLFGTVLKHADLTEAQLPDAAAWGARFDDATLREAILSGAELGSASLQRANLVKANLEAAKMSSTNLEDSEMWEANLKRAALDHANLKRAKLFGCDLTGASLRMADCGAADLQGATLTECSLFLTNFERADLRNVTDAHFDSTIIRAAMFSSNAKDWWSVLRRRYTGPMFALHLLLLVVFALPYLVRAIWWHGISESQGLVQRFGGNPCLVGDCAPGSWTVGELVIGLDRPWYRWSLVIGLILYNISRGFLTLRVSLLRDQEERSGSAPSWGEYRRLVLLHGFVYVLFGLVLVNFGYELWRLLWAPVSLPLWKG